MDDATVVVRTASSPFEAEVMAVVLRAAGVPVYVAGQLLNDPFALSQQLAGLLHVDVCVPASMRERAERALEEAEARGTQMDQRDTNGPKLAGAD